MTCKYNNCKICGYKSECEIYKENAELKEELTKKADTNHSLVEQMAKLEEELKDANEKVVHLACNQNKDLKRQLTEAKEIIKDMLRDIPNRMWYTDDVIKRAEDFIKE